MDANETNTNATTEEERVLQLKSSHIYRKSYDTFMSWRSKNKISSFSEEILLSYFKTLKFKPSSLWTEYSKLKSTLSVYNKTDISKYTKLFDWLKKNSDGFEAKKAKTFTQEELNRFIMEAPDLDYLQIKVAVIFGIMGACGRQELQKLECQNVIDTQNTLIVNIMKTKKLDRTFAISGEHYHICKKYMSLRPKCDNRRFFITYSKGRCGNQNIGINKFGTMGKLVAKVLKLPNPELYTGHCFRRTSMNLSDEGDNLLKMRGWQTAVAEQCNETNRRTTRSSKMEDNNSLASEKLGLEKDVENWMKFKLLGGKLFLKKDVVPHFFQCQNRMVPIKPSSAVLERQRREILESIENTPDTTLESLEDLEIKETHDDDAQIIPKYHDKCIQAALYPHKRSKQVQVDMRGPQNIVTLSPKRVDLRNRTTLPVKLIVSL